MVLEEQLLYTNNIIHTNLTGKLKNAEFEFQNMFVFHYHNNNLMTSETLQDNFGIVPK